MQNTNLASSGITDLNEESVSLRHYEFKKRLGEGGFGQVHEAWDSKLCRPVAIKQLKAIAGTEGPGSTIQTTSLLKEARLTASLKHPAFVKIFAIEEEDNSQSIVMELVPGLTLKQLLQQHPQQPLPEQQAINIISQVAEAMQEAHASGLIHGDLKPSNLMVQPDGKVRILDFGLASQTDAQATTSMSQLDPQGTIAYMAPERMMGNPASVQSDIYALGIILYETLTGQRPFANASGLALAAALMQSNSDTWEFPAGCKPELIKLVLAMTAKQVEKRLGGMQEVNEELRPLVSVMAVKTVVTTSKSTDSSKGWKKLSTPTRAILISAVLIVLGYGTWQAVPYLELGKMSLKPFSESLAMKQGLEALKQFDRPSSLDLAETNFEAILKRNPEHAGAVAGLSIIYTYRYDSDRQDEVLLQKAEASAQQALKLNDKLALSHIAIARVQTQAGKNELALNTYEKALSFDPDNIFAIYGRVNVLRKMKRFGDAIKYASIGLEKFPQERLFAEEIGVDYFEQGKFAEAEQFFRLSIKIQPDSVFAYANLNNALVKQNRDDEGMQVLQQGLLIRPSALLYSNLGNALFKKKDFVTAAEAFELAVSPDKGNPAKYLGWANLGDTLLWIPGRETEAKKAYEKARELLLPRIQKSPNDMALLSRYGLYSARVGDKENASEYLQRALKLGPKDANVHFRSGLANELLGQRNDAIVELVKAIEYGYSIKALETEPDLLNLRRDPRYTKAVSESKY
ncbi:serine/threonine-protein kinase [Undibacterium pigrum]|uniref:Serine/threonine-protein kinase n=1 Tax=Undibacterium pigrum TaxID=401470 RepID=A0A318JBA1_9BURK|nr:serine/threonine-protein kinase [Undibacterium pigrum]PXX45337.1 serine/threonine-protein kinase [Undibacterium pigrum]